ncbi:hypothetical protein HK102_003659 [Quaeritorhiza haematococci]|nr:hypothetical protein HK102_003659 [Quaeritorhiza haematococci]
MESDGGGKDKDGLDSQEQPGADTTGAGSSTADTGNKSLQFYTQYFRRYELLIEFKNLRNPNHCPTGLYVMPLPDNIYEWYGVIFIHRGYYKEGVFKFFIEIPQDYPETGPEVRFLTDMFHPLIDTQTGAFSLKQQFPRWRPHKDYICHVLHYIKNSFKEAVLANLQEQYCYNADAYNMFVEERPLFAKLASQCAQLSASESILFDNDEESTIKFASLSDEQFDAVKGEIMHQQQQRQHVVWTQEEEQQKENKKESDEAP